MNTVVKIATPYLTALLSALILALLSSGISYLQKKKKAIIGRIGADKYYADMEIARNVFNQVEQQFKGLSGVANEKAALFDKTIANLIPGITTDQVEHYRESIAGQINRYIKESGLLEPSPYIETEQPEAPEEVKPLTEYSKEELIQLVEKMKPNMSQSQQDANINAPEHTILNTPSIT